MFIGSDYVITDLAEGRTNLGWSRIVVMERVLSHVVSRTRPSVQYGGDVRSYHYLLMCLVDDEKAAEIDQDQLQEEVM